MPRKDLQARQEYQRTRYQQNKQLWKNPDGTWKKQNGDARKAVVRAWYARNKELLLAKAKTRRLAKVRKGICPICQNETLLVHDHNHQLSLWRDWICSPCNLVLGHSYENTQTLRAAILYLERWAVKMMDDKEQEN